MQLVSKGVNILNKFTGEERRQYILRLLKKATEPVTGQEIAEQVNVSRQVIVTDMALLKTSNEPIIATNRGYLYLDQPNENEMFRRIIICNHSPEDTVKELETIVDCGVTVVDVIVEHPIYGDLTGSLMIRSRYDAEQFMKTIERKEATLLSVLTGGIHLHTLEADAIEKLDAAVVALRELGMLYMD